MISLIELSTSNQFFCCIESLVLRNHQLLLSVKLLAQYLRITYMSKSTTKTKPEREQTFLIKFKGVFKEELQERIFLGEELLKTNIQTMVDFERLKKEYSSWHDYNLELLKQSFNQEQQLC